VHITHTTHTTHITNTSTVHVTNTIGAGVVVLHTEGAGVDVQCTVVRVELVLGQARDGGIFVTPSTSYCGGAKR